MTIFNDTNRNRVLKLQDTLALLNKSFASNNATNDDMWDLLQPAIQDMESILRGGRPSERGSESAAEDSTAPSSSPAPQPQGREPLHLTIKKLAEEAPLKDLTTAMAVYLNRIDEELHKKGR